MPLRYRGTAPSIGAAVPWNGPYGAVDSPVPALEWAVEWCRRVLGQAMECGPVDPTSRNSAGNGTVP